MVSVHDSKKHSIKFPISLDYKKVRNAMESSTDSTDLLKADTGADLNLMNSETFDNLFIHLEHTPLRMEACGSQSDMEVVGKFHAFLR